MDLQLISQLLGTVAIVLSAVMKLPQVLRIFDSKSALGVSLSSLSLELFCYTVGSLYGFRLQYPLTAYGELGLLLLQNVTLHILIIHFERMMSAKVLIATSTYVAFIFTAVLGLVPIFALQVLFSFNLPIVILSKMAQIRALVSANSAGDVSLMTWIIATTGCAIRIFTTFVQTQDMMVLVNYLAAFVLNLTIVALIVHYQRKDRRRAKAKTS